MSRCYFTPETVRKGKKQAQCSSGNFLDSYNCAKGLPQGPLYSKIVQRQGCQVPIALVISLCKCVTSEKALIYFNAYAIRPPPSTFKGLLFNLHHHRGYSKPHNIPSSSLRLAYESIWLICLDPLCTALWWHFSCEKKTIQSFKQIQNKTVVWRVPPSASIQTHDPFDCHPLSHPHLLISPSAKSWHMWLYIECEDQITLAAFQLRSSKLYIAALHHSRQNAKQLPFLTVNRLLGAKSNIPCSPYNH